MMAVNFFSLTSCGEIFPRLVTMCPGRVRSIRKYEEREREDVCSPRCLVSNNVVNGACDSRDMLRTSCSYDYGIPATVKNHLK